MIFFVRPFENGESIRSALGFMSLTSRWGNVLFPGITVLTRDLHDIQALHILAIEEMNAKKPNWNRYRSRANDERIARKLIALIGYGKVRDYTQKMSYWQRYGSLLNHFGLLSQPKQLHYQGYRDLIFDPSYSPRKGQPSEKNSVQRQTRITNAEWFRDRGAELQFEVDARNISEIFNSEMHYWWLTGLNPPTRGVPETIKLSRQIEFALVVWQTTFEAAIQCIRFRKSIPKRSGHKQPRLLREFLEAALACKHDVSEVNAYQEVVASGLELHENLFRRGYFRGWSDRVKNVLEKQNSPFGFDQLAKLHDGTFITELANLPSEKLLGALVSLHNTYCKLQNKPGSIYVEDLNRADKVNQVFESLSLELNSNRWGLFGYRLGASVVLYKSDKYSKPGRQDVG